MGDVLSLTWSFPLHLSGLHSVLLLLFSLLLLLRPAHQPRPPRSEAAKKDRPKHEFSFQTSGGASHRHRAAPAHHTWCQKLDLRLRERSTDRAKS